MDIRSSLDGLKTLLGVTPAATLAPQTRAGTATSSSALTSDRATLSSAGSEVSLTAADSDVRPEKVASVQAALAAGTYNVPASAVASKMVDAMLGGNR
ncbi:MAG TPA: flagellar biosynthesis anti-sigma factor FlgM [Terracidiphilus sp.]|nr:flagellar biosynthesis anti-sigma factor FlgM [Terracidiphilus sp.]